MAQGAGDLPHRVELEELAVQRDGGVERKHRSLAASDDDRVESLDRDLVHWTSLFNHSREVGRTDEAHCDQVMRRVTAGVPRVAERIRLATSPVGAEDFDRVARFREHVVGMTELTP